MSLLCLCANLGHSTLPGEVDEIQYDDFGGTELDLIEADRRKRLDAVESSRPDASLDRFSPLVWSSRLTF